MPASRGPRPTWILACLQSLVTPNRGHHSTAGLCEAFEQITGPVEGSGGPQTQRETCPGAGWEGCPGSYLGVELLLCAGMAVLTAVPAVTPRGLAPLVTVLHAGTRGGPGGTGWGHQGHESRSSSCAPRAVQLSRGSPHMQDSARGPGHATFPPGHAKAG